MESPAQKMNAPLADGRIHSALTIALLVATSALSGAYAELFHDAVVQARTGIATGMLVGRITAGSVLSLLAFSLGAFVILCILLNRRVFSAIIRWRFLIAAVVLTVCVACKLSGSSVALWGTVTGGTSFQGTLLGIPREIRSDEWDVMTPFSFSQVQSGFLAQSPILGGGDTDVTMVYGQPAFATATLFRPFLWGYFLLGAERGLSFFWCARLLCMLLVGFSFFRLFSKDDAICALGSLLCALAPATQWWFAVNGTAELLIFGEGLVLVLARLLGEKSLQPSGDGRPCWHGSATAISSFSIPPGRFPFSGSFSRLACGSYSTGGRRMTPESAGRSFALPFRPRLSALSPLAYLLPGRFGRPARPSQL